MRNNGVLLYTKIIIVHNYTTIFTHKVRVIRINISFFSGNKLERRMSISKIHVLQWTKGGREEKKKKKKGTSLQKMNECKRTIKLSPFTPHTYNTNKSKFLFPI